MDTNARETDLRLRAAWLYFGHHLTQQAVAERLGVSRSKVLRLLEDVRDRQEVRIWVTGGPSSTVAHAIAIEDTFAVNKVIVVPGDPEGAASGTKAVGMALGRELAAMMEPDLLIGVGWGRTLHAALGSFAPRRQSGCRVVAMLGGSVDPDIANAFEVPWRFASRLGAECQLFPSPVVVASAEIRRSLLDDSGMRRILELGRALDLAIYSVGDAGPGGNSLSRRLIPAAIYEELIKMGGVADVLCQVIDAEGRHIDHPIRDRLMALPLDDLSRARRRVLTASGAGLAPALRAAIKRTAPTLLVIDEHAAIALRALI